MSKFKRKWGAMELWKRGMLLGGVWGIASAIVYGFIGDLIIPYKFFVLAVLTLPAFIVDNLMSSMLVTLIEFFGVSVIPFMIIWYLASATVGTTIGGIVGRVVTFAGENEIVDKKHVAIIFAAFVLVFSGLYLTGSLPFASVVCTDSDGGRVYTVKGTTSDGLLTKTDYCSGNILVEWYCSELSGTTINELHTCEGSCVDGACFIGQLDCNSACVAAGWEMGQCLTPFLAQFWFDHQKLGTTYCTDDHVCCCGQQATTTTIPVTTTTTVPITCEQQCTLQCQAQYPGNPTLFAICLSTCLANCGIPTTTTSTIPTGDYCTDTDGGQVINVAGSINYRFQGASGYQADYCEGPIIHEFYCLPSHNWGEFEQLCDIDCSDGKCDIATTTTTTIPSSTTTTILPISCDNQCKVSGSQWGICSSSMPQGATQSLGTSFCAGGLNCWCGSFATSTTTTSIPQQCITGQKQPCFTQQAQPGIQTCVNNVWGSCIPQGCNSNKICEPTAGEDWLNCTNDCSPPVYIWLLVIIVIIIIVAVVYTKKKQPPWVQPKKPRGTRR